MLLSTPRLISASLGSDLSSGGTISGDLIITGDLTVQGTTTAVVDFTTSGNVTLGDDVSDTVTVTGIITITNTGLHILDTNASHDLIIKPGSDLTADRILTLTTGDLNRTITLSGNPTLSDWFDQDVKSGTSPTFDSVNFSGALSGITTLQMPSGDIGATGARITKSWFTDLEVTNNIAGSITGNAATVSTNANLTGIVTSTGNATAIADKAIAIAKLADGTDGELITWSATGVVATVAVGSSGEVLTSNGVGAVPTFQVSSGGGGGVKNLAINGDMRISQRGTSFAALTASRYTLDRMEWIDNGTTAVVVTITQDSDVPTVAEAGVKFENSLKIDVTTAETIASGNVALYLSHKIEAQNVTFFGHGLSGALSGTLSFWFKSTKTGIFTVNIDRDDATKKYSTEFTVGTTDTWEKHTVTIPGDTSGTAIADDNGIGLAIQFMMAVGTTGKTSTKDAWNAGGSTELATSNQVNLLDNTLNNVLITGIQYEVDSVANVFDSKDITTELAMAQRYYSKSYSIDTDPGTSTAIGAINEQSVRNSISITIGTRFMVNMRTVPTVVLYATITGTSGKISNSTDKTATANDVGTSGFRSVNITSGDAGEPANYQYTADAEL